VRRGDGREGATGRGLKLHHSGRRPGRAPPRPGSAAVRPRRAKTAGAAPRAPGRATRCAWLRGGPDARCTGACRSSGGFSNAGFGTTYQVVNTGRLAELYPSGRRRDPGRPRGQGRHPQGRAGQGARRRRPLGRPAGERARRSPRRRGKRITGAAGRHGALSVSHPWPLVVFGAPPQAGAPTFWRRQCRNCRVGYGSRTAG